MSVLSLTVSMFRTVMVEDNKVEEALQLLNKIMSREGLLKRYRLTRYYEKPCRVGLM